MHVGFISLDFFKNVNLMLCQNLIIMVCGYILRMQFNLYWQLDLPMLLFLCHLEDNIRRAKANKVFGTFIKYVIGERHVGIEEIVRLASF